MRHRLAVVLGCLLTATGAVACSSSSSPGPFYIAADATADDSGGLGTDAPGSAQDAARAITDAQAQGDASQAQIDASAACTSYCACMATNCANEVFPGGCLYDCATQSNWDLACRANMCKLVPAQPNNDHCTHAFGMIQCLNE